MRLWAIIIMLCLAATTMLRAGETTAPDTVTATPQRQAVMPGSSPLDPVEQRRAFIAHVRDSINAIPLDTTHDANYWKRAMEAKQWRFMADPTVTMPKFLKLVSKGYIWFEKTFNTYDTAYVVGVRKNWKLMLKNNDWVDSYAGLLSDNAMRLFMLSRINSSVGVHLSYMGMGYTYMVDMDNFFGGDPTRHSKWDVSLTTSRFSFEAYRSRNSGTVNIHRLGDYRKGRHVNVPFDGLRRVSSSIDFYYFFNNKKYSQTAAYGYSKLQKRSAGTLLVGLLASRQDITINFSSLDDEIKAHLPQDNPSMTYRYNYRVFSFLVGYAYNWVFHRNWLFNVTAAPSVGLNRSHDDSVEGRRSMLSLDFRGRLGLVRNAGNFFYGAQMLVDGHFFHSTSHNFFNSVEDFNFIAGFRF